MTFPQNREVTELSADHAEIATAVLQLVGELSAERITIAHVAKHLGISRVSMARRCPTDADLWQMTAAFIRRRMSEGLSSCLVGKVSPPERLRSLVAVHIELIMSAPALRDILFSRRLRQNHSVLNRELAEARLQFHRLLARAVQEGIATGDFPGASDPDETARRIIEMLQGIVLRWSLTLEPDIALDDIWTRLDGLLGRSTDADSANRVSPTSPGRGN